PTAELPDKGDGDFAGAYETMSHKEFKRRYPDATSELTFEAGDADASFTWGDDENVTVCEYFCKEYQNITIVQLSNGECMPQEEAEEYLKELQKRQSQNPFIYQEPIPEIE